MRVCGTSISDGNHNNIEVDGWMDVATTALDMVLPEQQWRADDRTCP